MTNIKTGSSDVQDANEGGLYPFFIRSDEVKKSNRYLFDGEAILIPGEGRLGDIFHYIEGKFDYHQRVYKISNFKDVDGKYLIQFMKLNFKRHAMKFTVRATVDSLRLPMLTKYEILVPSLSEQQKIGILFKTLDTKISQAAEKLSALTKLKKAYLQRMFI